MSSSLRSMLCCSLLVAACSSNNSETSLVAITQAGPNATCPNGGTVISTGVDTNGDGTLGSDEITATQEVCNGASGSGSGGQLVNIDGQVGSNCPDGGTRIQTGTDTNGDGTLEQSEVTGTQYICNQLPANTYYVGTVHIGSAADLAAVQAYGAVIGDVIVDPSFTGDLSWSALSVVTGEIDIENGTGSAFSIDLPQLAQVGWFYLDNRPGITTLALDSLASANYVQVNQNPDLTSISFAKLQGAEVDVESNGSLTTAAFTNSTTLANVYIAYNEQLTTVDLSSLATEGGDVAIFENDVSSLSFPALTTIGGGLHLYYEQLASLSAASLATVGGSVIISSDENLATVDLSGLTSIGGDTRVRDDSVLTSLDFSALSTIGGSFTVEQNPELTTFTAPSLTATTGFFVDGNSALSTCAVLDVLTGLYAHIDPTSLGTDISANLDDSGSCTPADYCATRTFSDITGTFHFCAPGMFESDVTWTDAETACETFTGGSLATFGSAAEWADFQTDIGSAFANGLDGWLGYTDAATEGSWQGPNGSMPGYSPATDDATFWDATQPDGGSDENCAEVLSDGFVNDLSCTSTLGLFVCRN